MAMIHSTNTCGLNYQWCTLLFAIIYHLPNATKHGDKPLHFTISLYKLQNDKLLICYRYISQNIGIWTGDTPYTLCYYFVHTLLISYICSVNAKSQHTYVQSKSTFPITHLKNIDQHPLPHDTKMANNISSFLQFCAHITYEQAKKNTFPAHAITY